MNRVTAVVTPGGTGRKKDTHYSVTNKGSGSFFRRLNKCDEAEANEAEDVTKPKPGTPTIKARQSRGHPQNR
jgi:hypothetical protein